MGTMIEFTRPDGQSAPGYLALPAHSGGVPGIVMLEEWWGVNVEIRAAAERLAGNGFRVLIPDLFRGRVAATGDEANHMMQGLDFIDAAAQDTRGAAQYLKKDGGKVGAIGFCMGGALAMLAAIHEPTIDAVVTWYGYPPLEAADPAKIRVPIQGHWAEHDDFFTIEGVNAIEAQLKAASVPYEFHRYNAKHAFGNPHGIGNYHHESAEKAWERTISFFKRTLQ